MLAIAKGHVIRHCIIVEYIDSNEGNYLDVMKRLLKDCNIQNIYILRLYLYQSEINKCNFHRIIYVLLKNEYYIWRFNRRYFDGRLFGGGYVFVTQFMCPLLTMQTSKDIKVKIMEHSALDSMKRLYQCENKTKEYFWKKPQILRHLKRPWETLASVKRKVLLSTILWLYPNTYNLLFEKNGYALMKIKGDTYEYVDLCGADYKWNLSPVGDDIAKCKNGVILMVNHSRVFEDVPDFYTELKQVNINELYIRFAKDYVERDENIILQPHPSMFQKMKAHEVRGVLTSIKSELAANGYKKCYEMQQLFSDSVDGIPAELLINLLNVKKLIGTCSSLQVNIASHMGINVRVIADCKNINIYKKRWDEIPAIYKKNIEFYF